MKKIKLLGDKVAIVLDELPGTSQGGLILPLSAVATQEESKPRWANVVATGPKSTAQEGDRVLVSPWAGKALGALGWLDDQRLIINDDEIWAVVD